MSMKNTKKNSHGDQEAFVWILQLVERSAELLNFKPGMKDTKC